MIVAPEREYRLRASRIPLSRTWTLDEDGNVLARFKAKRDPRAGFTIERTGTPWWSRDEPLLLAVVSYALLERMWLPDTFAHSGGGG